LAWQATQQFAVLVCGLQDIELPTRIALGAEPNRVILHTVST
jgi:hypothetical protein